MKSVLFTLALVAGTVQAEGLSSIVKCSYSRNGINGQIFVMVPAGLTLPEGTSREVTGGILEVYPDQPYGAARVTPATFDVSMKIEQPDNSRLRPGQIGITTFSAHYSASGAGELEGRKLTVVASPHGVSYLQENYANGVSFRYAMKCLGGM